MAHGAYELVAGPEGYLARVRARGHDVLVAPLINRGTAFTPEEREALALTGLLPPGVTDIEGQLRRVYAQYRRQPTDLAKNVALTNLRERNEVLFHRLLADHIAEMLPIVYTPTVGLAIERFSHEYRRPRGVFLSVDHPEDVEASLRNYGQSEVDLLVATDAEGILGIGDQGVGGIDIAIGKLAVYTAAAGIHPRRVIPVMLDMGTDNLRLLHDDLYLGNRHPRVRDQRYDDLIDAYVAAATKLFPGAMLHWEDFGADNARRVLERYAGQICTFNDDMQGTAAVVLAATIAATRAAGTRMRDQRVVVLGAGTAGLGIADMMRDLMVAQGLGRREAHARFHAVGREGLLVDDQVGLRDYQLPYARPRAEVRDWAGDGEFISLEDVVTHVRPTVLIGTSTATGAFTEAIVKRMAADVERPIIMPLSNPTSRAEALPADLIAWTGGRALVATGSPFAPVMHDGVEYVIAQANNALVFPGLGLGVVVAGARRISDRMLVAAADAVAALSDAGTRGSALLPPVQDLRVVSAAVALAVAGAAHEEGLATEPSDELALRVHRAMWRPAYPTIQAV